MAEWAKNELCKIAEADDLHISPFREDRKTYSTPTSVGVGDALYVRGYTEPSPAGIRPRCGRRPAVSLLPA